MNQRLLSLWFVLKAYIPFNILSLSQLAWNTHQAMLHELLHSSSKVNVTKMFVSTAILKNKHEACTFWMKIVFVAFAHRWCTLIGSVDSLDCRNHFSPEGGWNVSRSTQVGGGERTLTTLHYLNKHLNCHGIEDYRSTLVIAISAARCRHGMWRAQFSVVRLWFYNQWAKESVLMTLQYGHLNSHSLLPNGWMYSSCYL